MPTLKLTDLTIIKLAKPDSGQVTYWDQAMPTFGIRCSQGGSRTFLVQKGPSRHTIGRYPTLKLADARERARQMLAQMTLGTFETPSQTYQQALTTFLSTHCRRLRRRTTKDYERLLESHGAKWKHRPLSKVSTTDIVALIDTLADTPAEAFHAFAALKTFFRWAAGREYINRNPLESLRSPPSPAKRARVLTEAELRAVWLSSAPQSLFCTIVRLCILLGQRRSEVGALRWSWIDSVQRTITLPASITKNKHEHTIPYGDIAADILAAFPRRGDLLFPARGHTEKAFNGWSKSKAALDKASGVTEWTLHDLRRTFSTMHAMIGTPPHIAERFLNHLTGTITPLAGIYNRYTYLPEMREAMRAYEQLIHKITALTQDETTTDLQRSLSAA